MRLRTNIISGPALGGQVTLNDLDAIAEGVAAGSLVPSLDVFLWSLAAAGLKHYGNDRTFFARLAALTGQPLLGALQLTADKDDCRRFLQLETDYGVLLDIDDVGLVTLSKRPNKKLKLTRVTTFGSLLVAVGRTRLTSILAGYTRSDFETLTVSVAAD